MLLLCFLKSLILIVSPVSTPSPVWSLRVCVWPGSKCYCSGGPSPVLGRVKAGVNFCGFAKISKEKQAGVKETVHPADQ